MALFKHTCGGTIDFKPVPESEVPKFRGTCSNCGETVTATPVQEKPQIDWPLTLIMWGSAVMAIVLGLALVIMFYNAHLKPLLN